MPGQHMAFVRLGVKSDCNFLNHLNFWELTDGWDSCAGFLFEMDCFAVFWDGFLGALEWREEIRS